MSRTNTANAFETVLTGPVNATDLTFNVESTIGTPSVPFYIAINVDDSENREYVKVSAKTSTSLTMDSLDDRHLEGSAASSGLEHAESSEVKMVVLSQIFIDLWDSVEAAQILIATLASEVDEKANNPHDSSAHSDSYAAATHAHDEFSQITANNQTGTTYTLALSDAGKVVELNNAAAIILTVPPNSEAAFPIGTVIELWQQGAGQVTVAQGDGVTVRSVDGLLALSGQYATAALRKRDTNEWTLEGRLE
jgi:hypothetical protein